VNRPRVVIYIRVSTDEQADSGTGLETQQLDCARYAERIGGSVVAIESDPGISGTMYPRPGLERALSMLETGRADALLAHRVDRIGRLAYISPLVWHRIKTAGTRLFTVQDGEVTDQNIILLTLRSGMAETDYSTIVANMAAGRRRRAEAGQVPSRSLSPYGYGIVQNGDASRESPAGTYCIVPHEAEVVRQIFTLYAQGSSLSAICKELQRQGVPTPRPDRSDRTNRPVPRWQRSAVSRILAQTAYIGFVEWGKTQSVKSKQQGRKFVPAPTAARVRITVPSIVDTALWERCQEQRARNLEQANGIRTDRKHRFAGLLTCPTCKRRMTSARYNRPDRATGEKPVIYHCVDHAPSQNSAGTVCRRGSIREMELRAYTRRLFQAIIDTPEFLRAAIEVHQTSKASGYDARAHAALIEQLKELEAKERATAEGYTRAIQLGTRPEIFEEMLAKIALQRKDLRHRKEAMEERLVERQSEDPQKIVAIAQTYARDLIHALDNDTLDTGRLNNALRHVIREIVPAKNGYLFTLEKIYTKPADTEGVPFITISGCQSNIQRPLSA
jgi:site-specific DNA recombinase